MAHAGQTAACVCLTLAYVLLVLALGWLMYTFWLFRNEFGLARRKHELTLISNVCTLIWMGTRVCQQWMIAGDVDLGDDENDGSGDDNNNKQQNSPGVVFGVVVYLILNWASLGIATFFLSLRLWLTYFEVNLAVANNDKQWITLITAELNWKSPLRAIGIEHSTSIVASIGQSETTTVGLANSNGAGARAGAAGAGAGSSSQNGSAAKGNASASSATAMSTSIPSRNTLSVVSPRRSSGGSNRGRGLSKQTSMVGGSFTQGVVSVHNYNRRSNNIFEDDNFDEVSFNESERLGGVSQLPGLSPIPGSVDDISRPLKSNNDERKKTSSSPSSSSKNGNHDAAAAATAAANAEDDAEKSRSEREFEAGNWYFSAMHTWGNIRWLMPRMIWIMICAVSFTLTLYFVRKFSFPNNEGLKSTLQLYYIVVVILMSLYFLSIAIKYPHYYKDSLNVYGELKRLAILSLFSVLCGVIFMLIFYVIDVGFGQFGRNLVLNVGLLAIASAIIGIQTHWVLVQFHGRNARFSELYGRSTAISGKRHRHSRGISHNDGLDGRYSNPGLSYAYSTETNNNHGHLADSNSSSDPNQCQICCQHFTEQIDSMVFGTNDAMIIQQARNKLDDDADVSRGGGAGAGAGGGQSFMVAQNGADGQPNRLGLTDILASENGFREFMTYLFSEFAYENLLCLVEVLQFREVILRQKALIKLRALRKQMHEEKKDVRKQSDKFFSSVSGAMTPTTPKEHFLEGLAKFKEGFRQKTKNGGASSPATTPSMGAMTISVTQQSVTVSQMNPMSLESTVTPIGSANSNPQLSTAETIPLSTASIGLQSSTDTTTVSAPAITPSSLAAVADSADVSSMDADSKTKEDVIKANQQQTDDDEDGADSEIGKAGSLYDAAGIMIKERRISEAPEMITGPSIAETEDAFGDVAAEFLKTQSTTMHKELRLVLPESVMRVKSSIAWDRHLTNEEKFLILCEKYMFQQAEMPVNLSYRTRKRLERLCDKLLDDAEAAAMQAAMPDLTEVEEMEVGISSSVGVTSAANNGGISTMERGMSETEDEMKMMEAGMSTELKMKVSVASQSEKPLGSVGVGSGKGSMVGGGVRDPVPMLMALDSASADIHSKKKSENIKAAKRRAKKRKDQLRGVDEYVFDPVIKELKTLLKDTLARFQTTNQFLQLQKDYDVALRRQVSAAVPRQLSKAPSSV